MSYVAVISGISGVERYLGRDKCETPEKKKAKRFRSEDSARRAAEEHVQAFPPVITRAMQFRVEPAEAQEVAPA